MQPSDYATVSPSGSDLHWSVTGSTSAVLILSSSQTRAHASVFNHSSASLYLMYGRVPTINSFDVKLTSGSYYELPKPVYTGPVYGVWDQATGLAFVLELGKNGTGV